MDDNSDKHITARETKALVALAFRNGPIESLHSGKSCPTCRGQPGFCRITDPDMKQIMKSAVDKLYHLLRLKLEDPSMYESEIRRGADYAAPWDEPTGAPANTRSQNGLRRPPESSNGEVLVAIPTRPANSTSQSAQERYWFERRRNRLEQVVSYIGFTVKQNGIASAYECMIDDKGILLAMIGADTARIKAEVMTYLELLDLPEGSRIAVFTGVSAEPDELVLS